MSDNRHKTYTADRVRQGRIILRRSWQRYIFIGGLVAAVVFMFVLYTIAVAPSA